MSHSSIIGIAKNRIVREFIKDPEIIQAIDSDSVTLPEKLINTHIFTYHQNPYTLETAGTFITIQVQIPHSFYEADQTFVKPRIEIWVISHQKHMVVDNIPKVTDNRNDYLSKLIDKKINGQSGYGIGEMKLIQNIEGAYQSDYLYRQLIFEGTDLNKSMCREDE